MNLKEIKEIIQLMNENQLTEIEVEREGGKLRLKKSSQGVVETIMTPPVQYQAPAPVIKPQEPAEQKNGTSNSGKTSKQITSPMVGTFYRAPSPEAPPFVELGQIVEIGQVVCIVEAMKLMNEIKSEIRGKITNVAVENAQPVEFGQVLFEVEML